MKKSIKIVSFFLAILMLMMVLPTSAFAARQETYIKEIRISTASTAAKAQQWLTDNGYTVVGTDLNQRSGKDSVYIGYKTTTNPDEAITDIALMQMNGGYVISEYETMVENRSNALDAIIASYADSIIEARTNYAAGHQGALAVYKIFGYFVEDDSGKTLAELFFGDTAPSKEILKKIFLQGNSKIGSLIYSGLALACTDYGATTSWLAKLQTQDPYGDYDDLLYSDVADYMFDSFAEINEALEEYIQYGKPMLDALELAEDMSSEEVRDLIPVNYSEEMMLYDTLSDYTYNKKPLLEFFLRDVNEIDTDEFYPLLAAMSAGQRAILKFVGLRDLIAFAAGDAEGIQCYENLILGVFADMDVKSGISVYYGVDRFMFSNSVALTDAALSKSASTGDNSWYGEKNLDSTTSIALRSVQGVAGLAMIAMPIWKKAAIEAESTEAALLKESALRSVWELYSVMGLDGESSKKYELWQNEEIRKQELKDLVQTLTDPIDDATQVALGMVNSKIAVVANAMLGVASGIIMIVDGIKMVIEVCNLYHPTYAEIPGIMIDDVVTDTDSYYVSYYAVKDHTGESGDLNAWGGQKWNALYTTTDRKAGDPVIASSLAVTLKDNKFPSDEHGAVHYFGETAAANVNLYHNRSTATATYIFYKRDHSLSMTASAFSGGQVVMFVGFGLIGGIVIGSLGAGAAEKKKKKREDEAESEDAIG